MPKPLLFVGCEKIILDAQGTATLVGVLQTLTVALPPNVVVPKDAISPKEWGVFTMWTLTPEDSGVQFTQVIEMEWPDGRIFKKAEVPFKPEKGAVQQTSASIIGFPIGQTGTLKLKTWLERDGRRLGEIQIYPVSVAHGVAPIAAPIAVTK
jgi:hypothetical protein